MDLIKSKKNSYIKFLTALNKKGTKSPLIIIEGKKIINEAILSGIIPDTVLVSENYKDRDFLNIFASCDIKVLQVGDDIINHICDTKTPQGIIAVVKKRDLSIYDIDISNKGFYIILEGVSDPGNVGTIIRSAESFCVDGIFLCGPCADIYNPKVIRSTMGGIFRTKIYKENDTATVIELMKKKGIKVYGSALYDKSLNLCDNSVDFKSGCSVIIGSEGNGIIQQTINSCDALIKIPMSGNVESLNAAVAASVIMWEAFKQRQ